MTYDEAVKIAKGLNSLANRLIRKVAADRLNDTECEEIGSSDISCEVISMIQTNDYYGPDGDQDQADILQRIVEANPDMPYEAAVEMFSPVEEA